MVIKEFKLKNRDLYLNRLISFQDTEIIKVITGIRRCGKSSLLKLMAEHLRKSGVKDEQIIELNFESMTFYAMDNKQLYSYVKEKVLQNERMYLFLDEVQMIPAWQTAVNSFRIDFDCDIYVTGSNAFLLSSELSTYISGRYVEIKMLPLSFREFIDFNDFILQSYTSITGETRKRVIDEKNEMYEINELFDAYLKYGGMPSVIDVGLQQDKVTAMLDGLYSAVVIRDILERGRRKEQRAITDPILLRKLIMFLADNIGNNTSATSIGNILVNEGLLEEGYRKVRPATQTIQAYIEALIESYIFYEIKRFDIKGKEFLRTLGKYYIVDIGLRNYLLGFREGDRGHILENIIYFELLRRGYNVAIGKLGNKEIDFVATSTYEKKYIQVTDSMDSLEIRKRELTPLLSIRDNYEKIVLVLNYDLAQTIEGIKIIKISDFLLEDY